MSELTQRFGARLPEGTAFRRPSLAALAEAIGDGRLARDGAAVVPLQPEGQEPPVFVLPGAIGSLLSLHPWPGPLATPAPCRPCPAPASMASRRWTPRWTWGAVSLAPDPTRERPERTEWHLLADLLDVFEALSGQLFCLSREAIQAEADNTAAGQAHDGHVVEDPLRAPIHLLRARDRGGAEAFQDQRPARGWGECIRAGVVVGDVPRTHITKLAPPQLAVLG